MWKEKKEEKKGLMENNTNKRESERESVSVIDTEEMRATGREAVLLLRREVP